MLCYSFSCGDITVHFPGGRNSERSVEGGGGEVEGKKNRKVEARREVAVALRSYSLGLLNLLGILPQRVLTHDVCDIGAQECKAFYFRSRLGISGQLHLLSKFMEKEKV